MIRRPCTTCPTSGYIRPASPHQGYGYGGAIYPNQDMRGMSAQDAINNLLPTGPRPGGPAR